MFITSMYVLYIIRMCIVYCEVGGGGVTSGNDPTIEIEIENTQLAVAVIVMHSAKLVLMHNSRF